MRRLITAGTEIAESALAPSGEDIGQMLDEAESRILEVGEKGQRGTQGFEAIQPVLARVFERIDPLTTRKTIPTSPACRRVSSISTSGPPGCRKAT